MAPIRLIIDRDFTIGSLDPRLFGSFAEHRGRCNNVGFSAGSLSASPNGTSPTADLTMTNSEAEPDHCIPRLGVPTVVAENRLRFTWPPGVMERDPLRSHRMTGVRQERLPGPPPSIRPQMTGT